VRLCRCRLSPTGDLGYRGRRGRIRVRIQVTVNKRTLPPRPKSRGGCIAFYKGFVETQSEVLTGFIEAQTKLLWN
jgi:hypothetical protein